MLPADRERVVFLHYWSKSSPASSHSFAFARMVLVGQGSALFLAACPPTASADMGANDGFIFVTEQTACKFHSRFMRQLRRCFTRHVGVDKMIADNAARFSKPLFRALHIQIAGFQRAVDRALQNHFIIQRSFVGIFNVVQRTGERGFIAVLNIAQTVIQPCTDGKILLKIL